MGQEQSGPPPAGLVGDNGQIPPAPGMHPWSNVGVWGLVPLHPVLQLESGVRSLPRSTCPAFQLRSGVRSLPRSASMVFQLGNRVRAQGLAHSLAEMPVGWSGVSPSTPILFSDWRAGQTEQGKPLCPDPAPRMCAWDQGAPGQIVHHLLQGRAGGDEGRQPQFLLPPCSLASPDTPK